MRKSRLSEKQIVGVLKDHEAGISTGDLCRRLGGSKQTLDRWTRKSGGLEVNEARRLRALEEENRRLKRLAAEQAMDVQALKDVLAELLTLAAKRQGVGYLRECWLLSGAPCLRTGGHQPVERAVLRSGSR